MFKKTLLSLLATLALSLTFVGCKRGTFEKAGREVDRAGERARDAADDAGERMRDATRTK